eukprot:10753483-Ditylum_brightwellii.AAC.1
MIGNCDATKLNGSKGLTIYFLCNIVDLCHDASDGPASKCIDYRKSSNPYESHYGDVWKERIKESTQMKTFVSICLLALHMYEETKKAFAGTKHEDNFFLSWCAFFDDIKENNRMDATRKYIKTLDIA